MLERRLLEEAMRRALVLAGRSPAGDLNPQVGCVILDGAGRIVAEGWHRGAGTPHAETDAISNLGSDWLAKPEELTLVVTLEPCNHVGKTGPCAEAIVRAGIPRVVYGHKDPGAGTGGGAGTLREAGVEVQAGLLASAAARLISPWLAKHPDVDHSRPAISELPRPHVTVKWAQSLDGRAAASDGSSKWITGEDARGDVHRRRAEADAIVAGIGTVLADDPALTARAETGGLLVPAAEQPVPVVIGHREIPADAQIRSHPALAANSLDAPIQYSGDNLASALSDLHQRGFKRVFVEGGPQIASAFLRANLVDEVLIYLAPTLIGGSMLALGDIGVTSIAGAKELRILHTSGLGRDLLIKAELVSTEPPIQTAGATEAR